MKKRCAWVKDDLNAIYHDNEWGRPSYDDKFLFEFLVLEGAQAGLSWTTILKRRDSYKETFFNYDVEKLSKMTDDELNEIILNAPIIKNKLKVYSVRTNAIEFLKVQEEFGSFSSYIWGFTDNKVIDNQLESYDDCPTESELSRIISKDLKKRGFKFVGPTIVYAYLEAVGIINDHEMSCFIRGTL